MICLLFVSYILIVNVADSTYQCCVTFCFSPFLYLPFAPCFEGPVWIRRLSYTHRPFLFIPFIFTLGFLFRALRCVYMCAYVEFICLCMRSLVSSVFAPQFIISRGLRSYHMASTPTCTYVAALHAAPMHFLWASCSGIPDSTPPWFHCVGYLAGRRLSYATGQGDVLLSFRRLEAGCFSTAQVLRPSNLILRKCLHLGTALPAHPRKYRLLMSTYTRRHLFEGEDCAVLFPALSYPACAPSHAQFPPFFPSCSSSSSPFLLFFFCGGAVTG
jgi:hypothetical protein